MEEEMAKGTGSAEKRIDSDLQLSSECRKPDKKPHMDQSHTSPQTSSVETEGTIENGSCVSVPPDKEFQPKPDNEALEPTVLSDSQLRTSAPGTGIEAVEENSVAGGASGADGLHILTNQELPGDEDGRTETTVSPSQKGTSEITDEGAVKKLDGGEAGEETLQLPKPYQGRPGAGCRLMVEVSIHHHMCPAWVQSLCGFCKCLFVAYTHLHCNFILF
jgi:hypothetical protein